MVAILSILVLIIFICYYNKKYGGSAIAVRNINNKYNIDIATLNTLNIKLSDTAKFNEIKIYEKTIDSIVLNKNLVVLIKNQTDLKLNGIFKVIKSGDDNDHFILNRLVVKNIYNTIFFIKNGDLNKDTSWKLYKNDIYKFNIPFYIFKNINLNFKELYLKKYPFWEDQTNNKNNGQSNKQNHILYNKKFNNIYTFNDGLNIKIDKLQNIKSMFIVLQNLSKKIYIVESSNKICYIKLYNNIFTQGITKLVINNNEIYKEKNNTFNLPLNFMYHKLSILYIEFEVPVNELNINKNIELDEKTNGSIYEILIYNTKIEKYNDYISYLNKKWSIFIDKNNTYSSSSSITKLNIDSSMLCHLNGLIVYNTPVDNIILTESTDYIYEQLLLDTPIINIDLVSIQNINLTPFKTDDTNIKRYSITNNEIDSVILKYNYVIMLIHQKNVEENGIYIYK